MTKRLGLAFAAVLAFSVQAADSPPEGFLNAWKALREAVLSGRVEQASALVHFPLRSIDPGHKDVKSTAAFKSRFSKIFEPMVVELIKSNQCETGKGDPGYEANCGNGYLILGFERIGAQCRLSYFGSINE